MSWNILCLGQDSVADQQRNCCNLFLILDVQVSAPSDFTFYDIERCNKSEKGYQNPLLGSLGCPKRITTMTELIRMACLLGSKQFGTSGKRELIWQN